MMDFRCSAFLGASLDGYIARADGSIDWLLPYNQTEPKEDYGYEAFYATVDVLVIGRSSFDQVSTFGEWPYRGKKVVVLSHRRLPEGYEGKAESVSASPAELAERLAGQGFRHAYVDGGRTVQSFLRAGLLQEITISWIPILLGEGVPLFGRLEHDVFLELLDSRSYPVGILQSRYGIVRK